MAANWDSFYVCLLQKGNTTLVESACSCWYQHGTAWWMYLKKLWQLVGSFKVHIPEYNYLFYTDTAQNNN